MARLRTMEYRISRLRVCDAREQGMRLIRANAEETGAPGWETNPDWGFYEAIEEGGGLFILGAWGEETLIGYVVCLIQESHPQHKDDSWGYIETLYVDPESRSTAVCGLLMAAASRAAKAKGAGRVLWSAPPGSAFSAMLDSRDKFTRVSDVYMEVL